MVHLICFLPWLILNRHSSAPSSNISGHTYFRLSRFKEASSTFEDYLAVSKLLKLRHEIGDAYVNLAFSQAALE